MSATVPRHDVAMKHAAVARQRRELLSGLVGLEVTFLGERTPEGVVAPQALYRERVGSLCRVVGVSEYETHAPLIVVFRDGYRCIAEPGHLAPIDGELP